MILLLDAIWSFFKKIPTEMLIAIIATLAAIGMLCLVFYFGERHYRLIEQGELLQQKNAQLQKELDLAHFSEEKRRVNDLALTQKANALNSELKKVQENDEPSKNWSSITVPAAILSVLGDPVSAGKAAASGPAASSGDASAPVKR